MVDTLKQLRATGSVLAIKPYVDGCFVIDNEYQHFSYDHDFIRVDENKLIEDTAPIHRYSHAISISSEDKIFLAKAKSSEGIVLNLLDKDEPAKVVDRKEGYIEASDFSLDNSLASFGSQEGRTYIYSAEKMKHILTLPPKNDYISKVCFSDDNHYLLSSCFNCSNVIYDFYENKISAEFITASTLEDAIFIQGNRKLFYILRNGASGIYNIEDKKIETENNTFTYWPTSIVTFLEDKYVLIGTKSKYLMLFDIEENALIAMEPLSFIGISSLSKKDEKLYVGFINGVVQVIDTAYCLDAFEVAYKVKDFDRLHQLVDKNVFLKLHPYYNELKESSWVETLPRIIELLSKGLHTNAKKLAAPYLHDETYQKIYLGLQKRTHDIIAFYKLIDKMKIKDAYMKVEKMPLLKYAPPYILLEKKWTAAFLQAKKLIKQGITEYKRAYRLLDPFSRIPEKRDLILALVNQPEVFFDSEKEIEKQNFQGYFEYIKKHQFLEKTPLHAKVKLLGESYDVKLDKAEHQWDLKRMKYFSEILQYFPEYKNRSYLTITKLKAMKRVGDALKENNLADIFALMEQYGYINTYPEVRKIRQAYIEASRNAINYALVGDGKNVYRLLREYWDIQQCTSKVSTVMRLSFYNEMKKYHTNKKVDWPTSIGRYLERFGSDADIENLANDVGIGEMMASLSLIHPAVGLHKSAKRISLLSAKK